MKATGGNLKLDQSYSYIESMYCGKFSDGLGGGQCENCGMAITNIAIVEGSNDKIRYSIGLDCASTLTGITPNKVAQSKKVLAREARFCKFLATECKTIIIGEKGGN